jgi:D-alanyl-lipoteichoic acid acyltransferase DltB (MBOAT superfamily)
LLVISSFIFYGWWDWRFLFLIIGSGLLDFFVGLGMKRHPHLKKPLLVFSILGNIGALATFKYLTFLTANINQVMSVVGTGYHFPLVHLTLPVGISFYTFQSLSYTIDIYRDKLSPTHNVFHFFAYLSMFPQLVAGPIVRAADLLPQLTKGQPASDAQRWDGLKLIAQGYFKKVVIADNLAPVINTAFEAKTLTQSCPFWWVIVTMFAFQIYCDFSGYSDIARGLAKWMGYEFPLNFDHPYVSRSIREFWSRWHISLSTWFRDYVYIPLGGSRCGEVKNHRNLWITMVVSGLWHGAAWTFVIWGALHAAFLSVERISKWPRKLGESMAGKLSCHILVLMQVWVAWVFFRAESLSQAVEILTIMFNITKIDLGPIIALGEIPMFFLAMGIMREVYIHSKLKKNLEAWRGRGLLEPVLVSMMLAACVYLRGPGSAFIYFQF